MKNKYIILAFIPILFQSALYCENQFKNIDQMIINELKDAQSLMKSTTIVLELQHILDALVMFAKKTPNTRDAAITHIITIKKALQKSRSEEYKTNWDTICSFFGSDPKKVKDEINPAIAKTNKALKDLNVVSSSYGYIPAVAGIAVGAAAAATGVAILWNSNQKMPDDVAAAYKTFNLNPETASLEQIDSAYRYSRSPNKEQAYEKIMDTYLKTYAY